MTTLAPARQSPSLAGLTAAQALAVLDRAPPSRLQLDTEEIAAARHDYLRERTDELLKTRFDDYFFDVTHGQKEHVAIAALKAACEEEGQCWDGISAFKDLMHAAARAQAEREWPRACLNLAPECCDCRHSRYERDQAGTGDSPSGHACTLLHCPWGKP